MPRPMALASGLSPSMADYLKAIHQLTRAGDVPTTQRLAARLGVAPPSVTQMIKRLGEQGYVTYAPDRPIALTELGSGVAAEISERCRLIETYLVRELGYAWHEAGREADRLEHVLSARLQRRMAARLAARTAGVGGSTNA